MVTIKTTIGFLSERYEFQKTYVQNNVFGSTDTFSCEALPSKKFYMKKVN